jgi:hypothetical protein
MLRLVSVILTLFILGISVMALSWINKLEETMCKCSEDYKRDYIKYYLYVYILFLLLTIAISYVKLGKTAKQIMKFVNVVMIIGLILNTIFAIMYINDLRNCKCSEDIRRDIYYYLNIIYISFVALGLSISILGLILGMGVTASYSYSK